MHLPANSKGLVDYLSRHPTGKASPLDSCGERFVIDTIETIHLNFLKNYLKWTSPTNQISELTKEQRDDVITQSTQSKHTSTVFRHFHSENQ